MITAPSQTVPSSPKHPRRLRPARAEGRHPDGSDLRRRHPPRPVERKRTGERGVFRTDERRWQSGKRTEGRPKITCTSYKECILGRTCNRTFPGQIRLEPFLPGVLLLHRNGFCDQIRIPEPSSHHAPNNLPHLVSRIHAQVHHF